MSLAVKITLVILCAMGLYVSVLLAQSGAAEDLCRHYPVGSAIDDLANLEGTFFLSRMGPVPDPEQAGAQYVVFCAGLSMCETSCGLKIKDNLVVEAIFSSL